MSFAAVDSDGAESRRDSWASKKSMICARLSVSDSTATL